jgi:hypothetical protein
LLILYQSKKKIFILIILLIENGLSLKKRYKTGPGKYEIMIDYLNEEFKKIKGITLMMKRKGYYFLKKIY